MQEKTHILDRVSSFSLLLTMIILMIIGAALIPLVDVGSSPKPRQGKTLTISYGWRNASPKVVEQEVTSKIEGLVSAVKGVAEVSSESYFGSGRVTVVLKKEADVSAVKFEISSLLKQVRKKLPEEVSYPELTGGEVVNDGAPQKESPVKHLLTYQVNSNLKGEQIKEYVEKNVEPVVRAWEEVKSVDVTGGTSKYMEITYDPLIVANYGLTVADVEDGIKSFIGKSDIVGDVMYRDEDGEQSRVTLYLKTSRFARQIGEMPLKTVDGKIIYLNDLATFEYRDRLPGSYYRVNGLNTIYMNIVVDADANEIELSRQLRAKIEELKPRLRDGMYLTLTYDAAKEKQSELEKLITRTLMSLAILEVSVDYRHHVGRQRPDSRHGLLCVRHAPAYLFVGRYHGVVGTDYRRGHRDGGPLQLLPQPESVLGHTGRLAHHNRVVGGGVLHAGVYPARPVRLLLDYHHQLDGGACRGPVLRACFGQAVPLQ